MKRPVNSEFGYDELVLLPPGLTHLTATGFEPSTFRFGLGSATLEPEK